MELPDQNNYEMELEQPGRWVCVGCKRDADYIDGKVDNHIMGCAFRSHWYAILYYNQEQSLKQSFDRVNSALKKME